MLGGPGKVLETKQLNLTTASETQHSLGAYGNEVPPHYGLEQQGLKFSLQGSVSWP